MRHATQILTAAALGLIAVAIASQAQSSTLDSVKKRGDLRCGVNIGLAGFSAPDDKGEWTGLDVDFCRAVASAIFKDATRVKFVPLSAKERFTALQSGEIDLLSRNTTWTMSRGTQQGLAFVGVTYYDGQGFLVKKSLDLKSVAQLAGASICMQTGTTNELNVADYFRTRSLTYNPVVFEKNEEAVSAFNLGRCDAYTTDASGLYAQRIKLADPSAYVVLSEIISKEPLGPAVRQGDDQWANLVQWTLFAWLNAEGLGVTQENVDEKINSGNPEIRRLLGTEGEYGLGIGLDNDWAYQIVKNVGNYGQSFERNVGKGSRLNIARDQNKLWKDGGLHYAPPIR
ncbi:MAG: amino acid ABC transporter substrate-binding protein [Hyphomicrobiaceae bacterium]|nr:amino acid ABC transporter substrate-binding protein [Hyphomicrobiaceae bacterium]